MTTKKIYGPWIKWNGGERPVPPGMVVEVKFRGGISGSKRPAGDYCWHHDGYADDIISYHIVTEQPDIEAAQNLLREYGYTVTPPLTFEDITPMTEAPQKGTWYWVIQPFNSRGVEAFAWGGDEYDLAALRHRMAYLEREHAVIAAKHIFGLKGGRAVTTPRPHAELAARQSVTDELRLAARNAALAGLRAWSNLCNEAADAIDNLRAEKDRLMTCLEKANISTEHFEREWYLHGDELDNLRAQLAEAQKDSDRLDWIEQNANMGVVINRLKYITDLSRLVYEVAVDDVYATEDTLRAAIDAAKGGSNA